MKTLLFLKRLDLFVQLLGLLPILFAIVVLEPYPIILSYLWVGSAQVISCILNSALLSYYQKHMHRKLYLCVLAVISVLIGLTALVANAQIREILFYTLMAVSPFIAVWYMWISYKEMKFAHSLANRSQFVNI